MMIMKQPGGKILDVCDDLSLGRTRHNIHQFLSSEEAHDKYLDRSDKEVSSSGMKHIFMHKKIE